VKALRSGREDLDQGLAPGPWTKWGRGLPFWWVGFGSALGRLATLRSCDNTRQLVDMEYSASIIGREQQIIDLFIASFAESDGTEEAELIGEFVRHMLHDTPERDLFVFIAEDSGEIIGSVMFSRLIYDEDERVVFILSPLAVATEHQGKGIGQSLVTYGLKALEAAHVDAALTYGDPAYYSKVGFLQISEAFAAAPFALTRPEGWLAQSLTDTELAPLKGSPHCVEALSNPMLW